MALSLLSVASGLLLTPSAVRTPSNIMMTATLEPKAAAGATGSSTVEKTVMKFGGSSVRDAERITEVCNIITSRIELGEKPHAVCSAMGKTTNNLLAAADMAIAEGKVDISVIRQLHADTADTLGLNDSPAYKEVVSLLDELERRHASDRLRMIFERKVEDVDPLTGAVDGETFDLVAGCDGVNSATRGAIAERCPGFDVERVELPREEF